MAQASRVSIDNKEYEMDTLSESAQAHVKNVSYCDTRLQELQGEIAMVKTARAAYMQSLLNALPKDS